MTIVQFAPNRVLKRVPLDFYWPLNQVWVGYVNPHYRKCPSCQRGYTAAREVLIKLVQLVMIAGESDHVHPWLLKLGVESISPDMAELTSGLAGGRPRGVLGYDDGDLHRAVAKIVWAAGLPGRWGTCSTCGGSGQDPTTRRASDDWKPTEPPTGNGWQLWETCTEGSPISPVFSTLDVLATWLAGHKTDIAGNGQTKEWWGEVLDQLVHDLLGKTGVET